jgi:Zn-dependent protease with chaperone function
MQRNKHILNGLDHADYEHPFDKKALDTLESTKGLGLVGNFITKYTIERLYTVQYTGSNLKITNENYPDIYQYLEYACKVLDVERIPDLYIQWGYNVNACTVGSEHPIVILNSGVLDLCDDEEILFVIGHECGHIKSNHMLYHMMAQLIDYIINMIPGGALIGAPLQFALYYWDRMSEFTADRAGLLCCQNKNTAIRALIKMAGLPIKQFPNVNINAFLKQAEEFKQLDYENLNKVIKFISIADATHPWTVMRASQLIDWIESGEARKFIPSL